MNISGNIVDVVNKRIFKGLLEVQGRSIESITEVDQCDDQYILPGFVDAHVHVESSMLTPSEFARMAVVHGTVATVSDPHEIANVMGIEGVNYMIENGRQVPFKFYFGAPSCVPATTFETAGAEVTIADIEVLLKKGEVKYLAEMMNWPGVLNDDPDVMAKIALAKRYQKQVDGHAPGLLGTQAKKYFSAGITTDHECFTASEALDKLDAGVKILIREGSAAKNFEALADLLHEHSSSMMFCSDDKHPDSLEEGHINQLVLRSLAKGVDLFKVLRVACVNPVKHYGLDVGLLQRGDPADFIVVNNLTDFKVVQTIINGKPVAQNGKSLIKRVQSEPINNFMIRRLSPDYFQLTSSVEQVRVIEALNGELITQEVTGDAILLNGNLVSNPDQDILKIAVVNRYHPAPAAIGFIKNFGLKQGAMASSVAHDSHNIIAIGVSDEMINKAVNLVIDAKGGLSAVDEHSTALLPLPLAGLMSVDDGYQVSKAYQELDRKVKSLGSTLTAPFMTLSFMALLVIPNLKLSDKGLFDGRNFRFVDPIKK